MKSYITSFNGLFDRDTDGAATVRRIEIPIIQRDYAQGRHGGTVDRIRADFLDALHGALTAGPPISLDFVYGDVVDGTLRPLDGQQRLTTLFLLHWYLAWRAGSLDQESGWKRFAYATRPSARRFCERLVEASPPGDAALRPWFEDQPWFLSTWEHDPTIQSMLVMLEAIHSRFADADCGVAWRRLVDRVAPGITFHRLPIDKMGLSEDLYIKMNSRGKPLTAFENFKARFEQVLEHSCPGRLKEFADKIDGEWADLLWPFRGADDIVDDEFLHYLQFVTELCLWQDGLLPTGDVEDVAERVYGASENAAKNVDFLIRAFDAWIGVDAAAMFSAAFSLVSPGYDADDSDVVVLYGRGGSVNLFAECCAGQLSAPRKLLLYAVLLHRLHTTEQFPRRLRVLRNLIEASGSEIRADRMPALLADVRHLIVEGGLDAVKALNQAQLADEKLKARFLDEVPALRRCLFRLEDHPLLRGCLAAFELDRDTFERRAKAFYELFAQSNLLPLTGALLAAGDYSQRINHRSLRLGSSLDRDQWREEMLTGSSREELAAVRKALGRVLDAVAAREGDVQSTLAAFTEAYLESADPRTGLDWRWYFARYSAMRAGRSGIYTSPTGALGYTLCMLDKQVMSSYYRDPYLAAIRQDSGVDQWAVHGSVQHPSGEPGFTGYETEPRWMRLLKSGAAIQVVSDGFLLRAPTKGEHLDAFTRVCEAHGIGADLRLKVPQITAAGGQLDTADRVQLGAALLRDLVGAGL